MVQLSPAEKSYLYDSLTQQPIIRPDLRSIHQYRPLVAKTSFLPGSNGSARVRTEDGSECIVSVKSKVVLISEEEEEKNQSQNLIEVDIDIVGHRDDSNYVANLKFQLTNLLQQNFPFEVLKLTSRYTFKLYIDCIIISHSCYPLSLISLTNYLALKTTRLPLLISDVNDEEIAELPTFSDDWENAKLIQDYHLNDTKEGQPSKFQPPIFITIGVIGKNLIFDPSFEEEQVLENGLIISFYNNKVITPISNTNFAVNSNNSNFKGLDQSLLIQSLALCNKYCPNIIRALDSLIEEDNDDNDGSIF
ncbi:exosome complex exonuclease rrp42 (ec 3.1.13.-) (ribosomal rna processing protein 42) [Candida dubliniensis CD36]|uniref:Ribosomal RNA-processing protein 42 n=1 Tax=Candida dubliniensis (strain CD36 / ATCC MYA-646 / CBS 7987 / NCPF 3949 / NRRL Y-17841) TaxID=573826 RepID=B9WG62_CANDC|nr:exosome complex exonuclease rrp42 (ec 3.1.13.-) (ribosomal rna processing protein 42) [Candida dubliniensis CD36]CAX42232.1 exosome complex exonuclease rrp42 (ec 3.1.13.-) (ribosomal rna processing protein 42) [Candida dubliniensis CD36]